NYTFESQRIKLDLGSRIWPTSTPCYGYAGKIAGTIHLSRLDHVKHVSVTLEAIAKVSFTERGSQTYGLEKTLFRTATMHSAVSSTATSTADYPFSLAFPTSQDNTSDALPPSHVQYSANNTTEVRYRIHVDVIRSGLRRRESLIVPILYLPRSYTPSITREVRFNSKAGLLLEDNLKELHLAPKFLIKSAHKDKSSPKTDVEAKIALPSPLAVVSGDRIPFVLTIQSESPALTALYNNVVLQLIKVVKIKAYEKTSAKETIISSGEVYDVDQCNDGIQVLRGELCSGPPETESSWSAAGLIENKHILRLSIKPPSATSVLSSNLPIFEGSIAIKVTSNRYDLNLDMTRPLLSLINADNG
ncbi:hypothetical protein FRC07_011595, partial [Ceratobasidium sp. 392]